MSSLKNVNLPALLVAGDSCFTDCFQITGVTIPSCVNLGSTVLNNDVFGGINGSNVTLIVPNALMTCNSGNPDGDIQELQANNTVVQYPNPTPSNTRTPSRTPSVSITPSITITPSKTPSISPSITPSRTPSITITPSITPSRTPSITITPSRTPSISRTPSRTPSITPPIPLTTGLISVYNFENDSSDYYGSYNATSYNNSYPAGKLGTYGIGYNGVDAFTTFQGSWGITGFPFSISLWAALASTNDMIIISDINNSDSTAGHGFFIQIPFNSVWVGYYDVSGGITQWSGATSFGTTDVYKHVTLTCDTSPSTAPIITINNTLVTGLTLVSNTATSLYTGGAVMCANVVSIALSPTYFSGRMDQLAIWNRVLSSGDKTKLYNGGSGLANTSW